MIEDGNFQKAMHMKSPKNKTWICMFEWPKQNSTQNSWVDYGTEVKSSKNWNWWLPKQLLVPEWDYRNSEY